MKELIIEKEKLLSNIGIIKKKAKNARIIAVLKANGYGIGAVNLATILKSYGINFFAVATLEEAISLREEGIKEEILLLCSTSEESDIDNIIKYNITPTIGSIAVAAALNGALERLDQTINAHIEIDTGFGRYGFMPDEIDKIASVCDNFSNIKISGIYSHLSSSFLKKSYTNTQILEFTNIITKLKEQNIEIEMKHIANSNALFNYDESLFNAVRVGSAFLGRVLAKKTGLQNISYLQTDIKEIKWLPKGHNVGYGNAYVTKAPTRIAVINVGYSDGVCISRDKGLFRFIDKLRYIVNDIRLSKKSAPSFTLNGKKAYVIARANVSNIILDVTNIDCKVSDVCKINANPILIKSEIQRIFI
ncbi:MAG: alanine racemase [Clostridia bacterium]